MNHPFCSNSPQQQNINFSLCFGVVLTDIVYIALSCLVFKVNYFLATIMHKRKEFQSIINLSSSPLRLSGRLGHILVCRE